MISIVVWCTYIILVWRVIINDDDDDNNDNDGDNEGDIVNCILLV